MGFVQSQSQSRRLFQMTSKEQEMNRPTTHTSESQNSRPIVTQEWSLHAELTFSHDGLGSNSSARQQNYQPSSDSGVYTSCSWGSPTAAPVSSSGSAARQVLRPCYGFQRGNILFTTTPPSRTVQQQPVAQHISTNFQSSGSSEPSSLQCSTISRSPQPYNRRCKSTCSIILSEVQEPPDSSLPNTYATAPLNRGTSCSPIPRCYHTLTHRCGDPVCYHASCITDNIFGKSTQNTMPASISVPDIDETCEVCGGGRSPTSMRRAARANTFTTHFCTHVPERAHSFGTADKQTVGCIKTSKDAAIQTSDLVVNSRDDANVKESKIIKDTNTLLVPGQEPVESSSGRKKPGKKLSRSPARLRGKSPLMQSRQNSVSESRASSPEIVNRKPRTVHIDVYCTGSEDADADASNTSDTPEEGESWSSPQTVFESDKLKVVHTRAGKNQIPQAMQAQESTKNQRTDVSYRSESFKCFPSERIQQFLRGFDSDDGLSSHYPSKQSSYTTFQDTESSLPSDVQTASRNPSSSTISSSCALFEEYDSIAATSWKDTVTEIDSIAMSNLSLALSDSFEYADAMDRLRIREKEKAWAYSTDGDASKESKTWQSPSTERKHLLQKQKFKEYVEKHHGSEGFPLWKPNATEESEEEDDDETGDAWVFSSGGCSVGTNSEKYNAIKREDTVRKASGDLLTEFAEKFSFEEVNMESSPHFVGDSGSLSDSGPPTKHRFVRRSVIGPFGVKPPSPPPSKLGSVVTSPFTTVRGGTNQLHKAQKFGTIIGAFRKPGHHIGPARNPDCTCEHCREYYENIGRRGRARSVGDMPCVGRLEWKT